MYVQVCTEDLRVMQHGYGDDELPLQETVSVAVCFGRGWRASEKLCMCTEDLRVMQYGYGDDESPLQETVG